MPLGSTWYNTDTSKRVIVRLFIEGENVTSYLAPQAFNWQKINMDGTRDIGWEADHVKDGYQVTIEPPFVGTLLVTIDDTYVKDETVCAASLYSETLKPTINLELLTSS